MAAVGGPIESISLSGRTFAVASDAEVQRKLGGSENEFQANGDGATGRIIKSITGWSLDGANLSIDDDNEDQEYIQGLADGKNFFIVVVTLASGKVYQGSGVIEGEMQYSSQNAVASVNLKGQGKLTPQ